MPGGFLTASVALCPPFGSPSGISSEGFATTIRPFGDRLGTPLTHHPNVTRRFQAPRFPEESQRFPPLPPPLENGGQSLRPRQPGQCTGAASFGSSGIAGANFRRPLVSEIGPRRRALLGPLLELPLSRNKPGRSLSAPCRAALSAYLPPLIFLSTSATSRPSNCF